MAGIESVRSRLSVVAAMAVILGLPSVGATQVLGTYQWQTQPYCNVVTLTLVQHGAVFQLLGSDNLCGAGAAPVVGTAVPVGNAVAFGLTVSPPSGVAAHLSATLSLTTISGTWSDADGHSGAFAFNGVGGSGTRPAPVSAAVILPAQFAPAVYAGSGTAPTVARSDHTHGITDLRLASLDHTKAYSNQSFAAGTCQITGLGDSASGVFRDGGLVIATWITQGINQNLHLFPSTTRSIGNGFGVSTYQICNVGTAPATLNGTVVVRLTVVR